MIMAKEAIKHPPIRMIGRPVVMIAELRRGRLLTQWASSKGIGVLVRKYPRMTAPVMRISDMQLIRVVASNAWIKPNASCHGRNGHAPVGIQLE